MRRYDRELKAVLALLKSKPSASRLQFVRRKQSVAVVCWKMAMAFVFGYLFFHPPLFPGAPPVERGEGPNSGPASRLEVG